MISVNGGYVFGCALNPRKCRISGGKVENRGSSLSVFLTFTNPLPSALPAAGSSIPCGLGDFRFFLFITVPLSMTPSSPVATSPGAGSRATLPPLEGSEAETTFGPNPLSFLFLFKIVSLSCASSIIACSISGNPGSSALKSSFFSTTSRHFVLAIMVAVLGTSIRIPISPKNAPGFSSAYVASPSRDVTATAPLTSQYIAFASSPSVKM